MRTKRDVIESFEDNETLTISLLLTEQCNFSCKHCFYSCGPDSKKGYMENTVYNAVKRQVQEFADEIEYSNISVNLIGGEPTLNLKEFKKALEITFGWLENDLIQGLQMTTNGWWLHQEKHTVEFFSIIADVIPKSYLGIENGFSVRVSNDSWHDEFRPSWIATSVKNALASAWDEFLLHKQALSCGDCSTEFKEWNLEDGDDCPILACEGMLYLEESLRTKYLLPDPRSRDGNHLNWVYTEEKTGGSEIVIPVGRGEGVGSNDKCRLGGCHAKYGNNLSYKPNGTLFDICCSGSNFPAGTCHDSIFKLLAMAMDFGQQQSSCYGCHSDAEVWIEENKSKYNLEEPLPEDS